MTYALQVITSTSRRGAESFALDLRARLSDRGRDAPVVALSPGVGDVLEVPCLAADRWRALPPLRRRVRASSVVLGHGSSTLMAGALACFGTGVPFVYRNIGTPLDWADSRSRRIRVRLALGRAVRVAALWEGSRAQLVDDLGVSADRVRVIPNGRPASLFPLVTADRRAAAFERLGRGEERTAVFLGALSPEKGLDVAIDAVARIGDLHLVVAGAGPAEAELRARAERVMPGRVRWLGSTGDPAGVLALADVVVLPGRTEGLPGVAIEAGLSGLPVAATSVGGTGQIVVDGETGVLVPPGDPAALAEGIERALAGGRRLGAAARRRCLERFELDVVVDQWERLLDEVAGGAW